MVILEPTEIELPASSQPIEKVVYDVLEAGHGVPACKRTALEVLALRQDQRMYQHTIRWVPTDEMLADPMTKVLNKENRVDVVLRQGTYAIMREVHCLFQKISERTINSQYKLTRKTGETKQIFCVFDDNY